MFTKRQKVIIITLICLILSGIVGFGTAIFLIQKNNTGSQSTNNSNNFETYLNSYKASFQNYILGNNEANYKDLLSQSGQAINSKDDTKILELKPKLKELEDKVTTENTNALNTSLEQIKTIDISKLPQDKKSNIDSLFNEISTTIAAKNFVKANSNIEQTKATILNELKANATVETSKIDKEVKEAKQVKEVNQPKEVKNKAVTPETSNNTSSSSDKLSAKAALKILQEAYPDYTYVDGGNIEKAIHDEVSGKDRPAYIFTFTKNSNNDTYIGFVFFDGSYKFSHAWKPE